MQAETFLSCGLSVTPQLFLVFIESSLETQVKRCEREIANHEAEIDNWRETLSTLRRLKAAYGLQ